MLRKAKREAILRILEDTYKDTKTALNYNSPFELFGEDKEFAINCIKDLRDIYRGSNCVVPLGIEFSTALKVYEEMDFGLDK